MSFLVGSNTDIGRRRSANQDAYAAVPEIGLFMVADGMGGHRGGETASSMAAELIPAYLEQLLKKRNADPRIALATAIEKANRAIFDRSQKNPALQGMGTTVTSLLFREGEAYIGHVGDSRCYYFINDSVWQLTRDHSLVQEKLRAGLITRAEIKTDRMKNVITRSVGFSPDVAVEVYHKSVRPDEAFLICSDGLSGLVEDVEMLERVQRHAFEGKEPQGAVDELIALANERGGEDNITVLVVKT